jgi:hypothetical protein
LHYYGIGRPAIEPPPVLQQLWADRRGFLPGEAGCERSIEAGESSPFRLAPSIRTLDSDLPRSVMRSGCVISLQREGEQRWLSSVLT